MPWLYDCWATANPALPWLSCAACNPALLLAACVASPRPLTALRLLTDVSPLVGSALLMRDHTEASTPLPEALEGCTGGVALSALCTLGSCSTAGGSGWASAYRGLQLWTSTWPGAALAMRRAARLACVPK